MKTVLDRGDFALNPPELGCVLSLSGPPGGGNKIYDRSPYGNIGTITGATWSRLPGGLWCLSFDGGDDYITVTYASSLDCLLGFTLECWFKPGELDRAQGLLNRAWRNPYSLYLDNAANKLKSGITLADDTNGYLTANTPLAIDVWHHCAVTWNTSDGVRTIYLNGEADGTDTIGAGQLLKVFSDNLLLGSIGGATDVKGLLALGRVYNRALSALEIQNHFNREKYLFGVW